MNEKEIITGQNGGQREKLGQRWDLIPYEGLEAVAEVVAYGSDKYSAENWKGVDRDSEQSPLNHALAHASKAASLEVGSKERRWELAKAATNLLFELWFEAQEEVVDYNSLFNQSYVTGDPDAETEKNIFGRLRERANNLTNAAIESLS